MPPRPRLKPPSCNFSPAPLQRRSLVSLGPIASAQARRADPFNSSNTINSPSRAYSSESKKESELIPSGHWYNEIKERLGKCILFGCSRGQARKIASLLRDATTEWRDLIAGSAGFLTTGNSGFVDQKVAFGETASWGYINNANYHRYVESSRVNWLTHFATIDPRNGDQWRELMTSKGPSLIMQSYRASYKFPLKYPDTVSAFHKLQSLPTPKDKIIFMNCVIISHKQRRVVAATRETAILFNHKNNSKMQIPPFMLDVFQEVWRQQEEEEKRARARIFELIASIRKFEKQIWDKEGAVEDMGA
ncbi:uncharacterized protein F4807DRAFT_23472 [Annulohypoxylon truncatum]|uniref:uncharacterized protein n=1 Tax=Annulohypoxylon truncatum TaxID=327061 RepID=UPI002008C6A5|nr:uncharacterized protein F4807DRAFT_23472 [Annulohypoxylon truncatum]KAI1215155.1 hypothetical protein F4807DRAFT_23472 [Annulohypoxylon truncatum]